MVDRWLELEAELTPLALKFKERDELRARILGWHPDLPADQGTIADGTRADVWISARDNERKITDLGKNRLHKLWGLRLFKKNCKFNLSQLPDPKDAAGLFTSTDRTGPRHLKVLLKPAA